MAGWGNLLNQEIQELFATELKRAFIHFQISPQFSRDLIPYIKAAYDISAATRAHCEVLFPGGCPEEC